MENKKLDRRFEGYTDFKYCVEFRTGEMDKFCDIRNWCWTQFGPSCEIDIWRKVHNRNSAWCWVNDEWKVRIYFASDKEYQWFILKWN